ncbi:unnamed protein product [Orchesella dallaii]|uniref:Uncharacterized protein n=1 Tax=Orchesella dallaii TaxID=48710 RepID=A0ABP1S712_9HEXA
MNSKLVLIFGLLVAVVVVSQAKPAPQEPPTYDPPKNPCVKGDDNWNDCYANYWVETRSVSDGSYKKEVESWIESLSPEKQASWKDDYPRTAKSYQFVTDMSLD